MKNVDLHSVCSLVSSMSVCEECISMFSLTLPSGLSSCSRRSADCGGGCSCSGGGNSNLIERAGITREREATAIVYGEERNGI